jgi:predicted DNA binding CopG/RHH family protein
MKALQILSDEQLRQGRQLTADQVLAFLEDFRRLHAGKPAPSKPAPSKLISIKVAGDLLEAFKVKASLHDTPYQTQIKTLMRNWLLESASEESGNGVAR